MKPFAIIESTTVAWAGRADLSAWRAPELHRLMYLAAHDELAEADGAVFSTVAWLQVELLRGAGVDVAVYTKDAERTARPFFVARGLTLIDRGWTDTLARNADAAYVITPRMTGVTPFHFRTNRCEVVKPLGLTPRTAAACLDLLGIGRRSS